MKISLLNKSLYALLSLSLFVGFYFVSAIINDVLNITKSI